MSPAVHNAVRSDIVGRRRARRGLRVRYLRGSPHMFRKQFTDVQDAWTLAHAIVDTVREPLVVLDQDLRVVAANHSFYLTFKIKADHTQGKLVYELGDGQWDIPTLRVLL